MVQELLDFREHPTRPSKGPLKCPYCKLRFFYRFWLKALFGKKEMAPALTYRFLVPLVLNGVPNHSTGTALPPLLPDPQ